MPENSGAPGCRVTAPKSMVILRPVPEPSGSGAMNESLETTGINTPVAGSHLLNVEVADQVPGLIGYRSLHRSGMASGLRQSVALPLLASAVAVAATPNQSWPISLAKIVGIGFA